MAKKKLKIGGLDIDMPEFDTVEEAYAWANSLDGATALEPALYAAYLANGNPVTLEF